MDKRKLSEPNRADQIAGKDRKRKSFPVKRPISASKFTHFRIPWHMKSATWSIGICLYMYFQGIIRVLMRFINNKLNLRILAYHMIPDDSLKYQFQNLGFCTPLELVPVSVSCQSKTSVTCREMSSSWICIHSSWIHLVRSLKRKLFGLEK